jgi:hypothetical protein
MTEKSLDFADNKYANLKDIVVFLSSIFVKTRETRGTLSP